MEHHRKLSDRDFLDSFENMTMNPAWFTHEAHLRVAYLYIGLYSHGQAAKRLCGFIDSFDKVHGHGDKFHKTITYASIAVVAHFMQKAKSKGFLNLMKEFPRLRYGFKELLLTHYSPGLISDERSRLEYLLPDKVPDPVFEFL